MIVFEGARMGGTCVNVGCVPKKVMFNTSHVAETIKEAGEFGFTVGAVSFDWSKIKKYRDTYVERLNGIYESGLDKLEITRVKAFAHFKDANTIETSEGKTYTAKHILVAVGGAPNKLGVKGDDYLIDSDKFFELASQPKKVAVVGAGYIAVELAGVFNGLGTDTSLFVRRDRALRSFDDMVSSHLDAQMKKAGMTIVTDATTKEVTKEADGTLTLHLENGTVS